MYIEVISGFYCRKGGNEPLYVCLVNYLVMSHILSLKLTFFFNDMLYPLIKLLLFTDKASL